jgi:predicted transcriptional regulator
MTDTARGAGAAPSDPDALRGFIEDFTFALVQMGFPRMPARVLVALFTTDSGRLTAAELASTLQASPAAVSGAVRYLIQIEVIRREGEPGSRRHYYRVSDNMWEDALQSRDRLMSRWAAVVRSGVGILGDDTPAGARLALSAEYLEYLGSELPRAMRGWQERKAALDGRAGTPAGPRAVPARGDDPPEPPAVPARGDDPPEPPASR